MLHGIAPYQGACPPQASFAVNCESPWFILADFEEIIQNLVRGRRPIDEVEVGMPNAILQEALAIILRLIEPNNMRDSKMLENFEIVFGVVSSAIDLRVNWPHAGDELPWDDPV